MDILLTGRLLSLSAGISEPMTVHHKVVAASDDLVSGRFGKTVVPFQISPHDPEFERIFHAYNFETVIFFSQQLYASEPYYEEYQDLENCLRLCAKHDVRQFVYLQPGLLGQESGEELPDSDLGMLFSAGSQLCDYYRRRQDIAIVRLRVPCLYGRGETASVVGDALHQARSRASILFRGPEGQRCGFLSQEDMGELLLRVVESWPADLETIDVPAASVLTFQELGGLFHTEFPTARLSYSHTAPTAETVIDSDVPRREFDWLPLRRVEEELPALNQALDAAPEKEKSSLFTRLSAFLQAHSFIVKLAELIIGFLLMELLNRVTSTTIQFQYIDFRLLYVVLMGTMHGMKTGLGAAGLASLSLLAASIGGHSNWAATVYNIDTWLPYIFYFLIGTVTGYVKDRLRNDNRFLTEEKAILEDKYVLLNEFYASALQNKEQYKTQIMSYRDSFGRLFDVTRSLDSTLVEKVFREALNALEGILDNKSVCLYSCDDKMLFGRLIACSREINGVTDKSLMLSRLERMTSEFRDGEVWVNRDRLLGYPEYAVPLYRDGTPIALIVLQKVRFEQMAVYYENLVKVICGLVKISLVRALEYTEQIEDEVYLPDSHIMTAEFFGDVIRVKEEMAENGVSEYILIRFDTTPRNRMQVGKSLAGLVRTTDVIGLGPDGELYLCLTQTNQENIGPVLKRIRRSGLTFTETDYGETQ